MSRFRSSLLLWPAAFVAAGWFAWPLLQRSLAADPLRGYRTAGGDDKPALEMRNFLWQAHDGPRLVAQARVGRVESDQSRDEVVLHDVADGRYHAEDGQSFGFVARQAVYYSQRRVLSSDQGGRVFGDEFDVTVPRFRYDPGTGRLTGAGPVVGTLGQGSVKAVGIAYRPGAGTLALTGLVWQGQPPQQGPKRTWRFTTPKDSVTTVKGPVTTMKDVTATDGEVTVKASAAEYNRDTDVLVATGKVSYFGLDVNATSDKAVVYRKERRVLLTGNVDLLVKPKADRGLRETEIPPLEPVVPPDVAAQRPKPEQDKRKQDMLRDSATLRNYPLAITAGQVEYWYAEGSRRAVLTGSPQARQSLGPDMWRVVWAHRAEYDGEKERIKLLGEPGGGKVRLVNSLGDDMSALWIDASTKEGEDDLSAAALEATMPVDEDELPREGSGGGSTGGGGGSLRGRIGA
jgi:lipopolysaccharide export system protein LptA